MVTVPSNGSLDCELLIARRDGQGVGWLMCSNHRAVPSCVSRRKVVMGTCCGSEDIIFEGGGVGDGLVGISMREWGDGGVDVLVGWRMVVFSIKQGQIVIIAPAELPVALPVTRKTGTGFCEFAKSVPAGNPYPYPWENPYGLHYPC
ncbi:hypothetical protein BD779DRAFT_1481398 [Infundibulicybe gibba]|nr:hypothetical protein BD779DRAFT_1481398 [Infundibulicybe gibba]